MGWERVGWENCRSLLEDFTRKLKKLGWRGLVVLNSSSLPRAVEAIASTSPGDCIASSPSRLAGILPRSCKQVAFSRLQEALGMEAGTVILATDGLLPPNIIAGFSGMVRGGGILAIAAPRLDEWRPGPPGGLGGYREYLLSSLEEARSILWLEEEGGGCRVLAHKLPEEGPKPWRRELSPEARKRLPQALLGLLTPGQAEALARYAMGRRRLRSFLVVGGRGRGKSFLLGVVLALEASLGYNGEALVVAPSPCQARSLYRGLVEASRRLGLKTSMRGGECPRMVKAGGLVARYSRPDQVGQAPIIVVDEAASVGAARLRRYREKAARVIAATTLYGYEGTGRFMAQYAGEVLPKPMEKVVLEDPARYPPGDPLEEWVNKTFVLEPEASKPPSTASPENIEIHTMDGAMLAKSPGLVRRIASLLYEAHYKSEPDYILVLLESPTHMFFTASVEGALVAAADVAFEEPGQPSKARISIELLEKLLGRKIGVCVARVVRIAVHPRLQGRGIGSRLLASIEDYARGRGCSLVTAVYGRSRVLGFWLRNNYKPYYMSPRFNRVTGEKNIAVAKPLDREGAKLLREAMAKMAERTILLAHIAYRDVEAETLALILESLSEIGAARLATPSRDELEEAKRLLGVRGQEAIEQVASTAYKAALAQLPAIAQKLGRDKLIAIVAYLLQGKPINQVAGILGTSLEEARRTIANAMEKLLDEALKTTRRVSRI
ncbi:MAG: GNAT family N-acetyltransferase [Pyrodictiaceae archaeon]